METLPLLIGISLLVIGLVVWFFFRMSDSGQFDDLEAPARRVVLDDDRPESSGVDRSDPENPLDPPPKD